MKGEKLRKSAFSIEQNQLLQFSFLEQIKKRQAILLDNFILRHFFEAFTLSVANFYFSQIARLLLIKKKFNIEGKSLLKNIHRKI